MQAGELAVYFALVFGIIVLPGMDMAFVLGNTLAGGRRAGMAAVVGTMAGGLCHMAMGVLGVALVLQVVPGLFTAMLLAGALYVAWIGVTLWRAPAGALDFGSGPAQASPATAFRGAMLTSLLNPKAYLFTLAVVPQFVHPERGSVWAQAAALALITAATQAGVYGSLALLAARSRRWLESDAGSQRLMLRVVAVLLIGTAAFTAWQGLQ
jgi:threonine/homoserine/homoserine lactone efflux protein